MSRTRGGLSGRTALNHDLAHTKRWHLKHRNGAARLDGLVHRSDSVTKFGVELLGED